MKNHRFSRLFSPLTLMLSLAASLLVLAPATQAQNVGLYVIEPGSSNVVLNASTNVFIIGTTTNTYGLPAATNGLTATVSDFDFVGLTFQENNLNAASTNFSLSIYRSYDFGTTYETTPYYTYSTTTASSQTICTNLDIHAVTKLGFVFANAGASIATNVLLELNLKAARVQTQQAGVSTGVSPGVPITNTNWVP